MSKIDIAYLNKLQEQYETKLAEFERNYQDTGSARTQNTIYKTSYEKSIEKRKN